MELLVCIKQVPDDSVAVTLDANGAPKTADIAPVVNAFDTYALEMAARFKEAHGGEVTVLTIGGEETVPSLRSCLAVGADHACKLSDAQAYDCAGTAYLLAQASKKAGEKPFDVIFCGSESTDSSESQVGAYLAESLGIPMVANVLALEPKGEGLSVKQETEDGYRMIEVSVPCVVTIVKPGYEPRYPSIKSKMASRKMPIANLTAADVEADAASYGPESAKMKQVTVSAPAQRQSGVKIKEKVAADAVQKAIALMAEQKLV